MSLSPITALIAEIGVIISFFTPCAIAIYFLMNGIKCLLRDAMLRIYYKNKDTEKIRQYEYENFVFLYKAYKALKGNSFIDKIYKEVQGWEVIS